jgi:two-component system LytT family sensor kinase
MNTAKTFSTVIGHISFWVFNYWIVALTNDYNWAGFTSKSGSLFYAYAYGLFFNATVFYSQVFLLFPIFYLKKKKTQFYGYSVLVLFICTFIETHIDSMLYDTYEVAINERENSSLFNLLFHIIYAISGFFYMIRYDYKKKEKIRQQLLQENNKVELKYLKTQLNPHFLFNGINSIYHLIGKNDDLAKDTLLQFSQLLRYQLYESTNGIVLEKELAHTLHYIKIEETRKGSDIQLKYDVQFDSLTAKIAPLLLIPFVENAFKHCSNHDDSNKNIIDIKIEEMDSVLVLHVYNSFDNELYDKKVGGIGLQNVKRRLSLLYPNKHRLEIINKKSSFTINLLIDLQD